MSEDKVTENEELYPCGLAKSPSSVLKTLFTYKSLAVISSSLLLALLGSASRGDTLLFVVMLWKNWDDFNFVRLPEMLKVGQPAVVETAQLLSNASLPVGSSESLLEKYYLKDLPYFIISSLTTSYFMFFAIGGFLQWHYYIKRRDRPEEWKCQPKRFLTQKNEIHEICLGAVCLLFNGSLSGCVTAYVYNGGPFAKVYYDINSYGWLYFFASTVIYFLMQDAFSYYYHRMLHFPFFYRNFHKWHHRYHSPTAFSATAMHPAESLIFQVFLVLPMFLIPIHFVTVIGSFYYLYYFGLIDHSGINMDSVWPWQPPSLFHDDHHRYFHCNFGFNTLLFDKFHGTLRVKDREYGETTFGGKGRALKSD